MADKRLELAYDAAQKRLAMQDATLGNVRTRANNLLATAALFTSFSAGVGLINTDPNKGATLSPCVGSILLALVILLGLSVLVVVWPAKGWHFGASASVILEKIGAGDDEDAIRKHLTEKMIEGAAANHEQLMDKQVAFRVAVVLLVVEVALLVLVLILR